jgi:DNA replication and repair protein RecF
MGMTRTITSTYCNLICLCVSRLLAVWVEKLDVTNWRNHARTTVNFTPGVTVLIGPNGQGKTNLVEALYFLATLSSHRVSGSAALISDSQAQSTLYAELRHDNRTVSVGVTLKRQGSTDAAINGVKAKASDIPQWLSMVMFAPEDIGIIRGEPASRRAFMDQLVVSASPFFASVYQDFDRVLKQRNSLLKSLRTSRGHADHSTLAVWNEKFVNLSASIMIARSENLSHIMPLVTEHYATLAGDDRVEYTYLPSVPNTEGSMIAGDAESLRHLLAEEIEARAQEEIDRGVTLLGPQRDDVHFTISTKPARTHASQGETWSLALSLRLATAQWLRQERSSGDPIIILDDVFAELDAKRRERLLGLVSNYTQIIVTSAVEEDLPERLGGSVIDVRAGVAVAR